MFSVTKRIVKPTTTWHRCSNYSSAALINHSTRSDVEYTKEPQYPPIEELSFKNLLRKKRKSRYENLKNLGTVEEKLFALNMEKYYGHKCAMLTDQRFPYNCLPLIQYSTRTVFHKDRPLPVTENKQPDQLASLLQSVKSDIEDAIIFEYTVYNPNDTKLNDPELKPVEKSRIRSQKIINHINRVLLNALVADNEHLANVEIDLNPRHEAFWFVGGMEPPRNVYKKRKHDKCQKYMANDPVDRAFQYVGTPFLTLRHKYPLKSIENKFDESLINAVPEYKWDPRTNGYLTECRHGVTIPGFWPGSQEEFGLLSYQSRNYMAFRNAAYGAEDLQNTLHAHAILCSFGWLFGQACYQGFSTFNDLTYPLTTQTILTDGHKWSFYIYQLNTTGIHCDVTDTNTLANECWGTAEMKLFEEINENGKLVGFNDDVLKYLVQFYINQPEKRSIDMKPYLSKDQPNVANIEEKERRIFLETRYKHLVSNRPRHRLVPEIYSWEKIYKIDNKTRQLEPKRRFFELSQNPWQRRLDDHTPNYIPKALRKTKRQKWEKTYYPNI